MAILTNAGKGIITNRMKGLGTEPLNIGWGTGTTAEAATQTDLVTPATEPRTVGTSSRSGTNNETYTVTGTLTVAGAGKTIAEAGLFDAAGTGSPPAGGNMFIRGVHSATILAIGESIAYTISITFS